MKVGTPTLALASALFFSAAAGSAQDFRDFVAVDGPAIALTHVKVIDGTGAPAMEDQTILIQGDQITAVDKQKIEATNIKALVGFITTFIQPPLEKGDDVKSLGSDSLVVLAKPNQQAWVQRFLTQNRKQQPYLLSVQATFVHMGDKTFESKLRPLLKKGGSAIIDDTEKSSAFMNGLLKKADGMWKNGERDRLHQMSH